MIWYAFDYENVTHCYNLTHYERMCLQKRCRTVTKRSAWEHLELVCRTKAKRMDAAAS